MVNIRYFVSCSMSLIHSQRGFSIVELLLAMLIATASIGALIPMVSMTIGMNAKLISSARLNEELSHVFALVRTDIRRAGYDKMAVNYIPELSDVRPTFNSHLVISHYSGEAENSCILYAYDSNENGVKDETNPDENYGFRLRDSAVEMRVDGALCKEAGWQDITDPNVVKVTELSFEPTYISFNDVNEIHLTIKLAGNLIQYPQFSRVFTSTIAVKNYYVE
jgi:prepilin peptidase dependent protein B